MSDFYDIADPRDFLPEPSTSWWVWLIVALAILLCIGVIVFVLWKLKGTKNHTTLLDRARRKLQSLRAKSAELSPHVTAIKISMIIRSYLEAAFGDPVLFETNEEFTLRKDALDQLQPSSREAVTDYLTVLSQIKYSPKTSADINQLIDDAESVIAHIEINVGPPEDS